MEGKFMPSDPNGVTASGLRPSSALALSSLQTNQELTFRDTPRVSCYSLTPLSSFRFSVIL